MKLYMYTDRGARDNNEDSVGICRIQNKKGSDEYYCEYQCGDKDRESSPVVIIQGNNIISGTGKTFTMKREVDDFHMVAVADGLGGHTKGEVASEWAIRTVLSTVFFEFIIEGKDPKFVFKEAYSLANEYIKEHAPEDSGTTLVVVVVWKENIYVANLGDSRAYVFKDGKIIMKTKDHSFVQSLVDAGLITEEEAREHPQKNVLLKALGTRKIEPDVYELGNEWDSFLLCSDGFSNVFTDEEITDMVKKEMAAKEMVELAIQHGSDDNVSVVVGWRK